MSMTETIRNRMLPWAGLIAGAIGWALPDQLASNLIQDNCRLGGPLLVGGTGLAGALLAIAGGWLAFLVWRASNEEQDVPGHGARRFIAGGRALAAGGGLGAILLQTIAGFIIPACHR